MPPTLRDGEDLRGLFRSVPPDDLRGLFPPTKPGGPVRAWTDGGCRGNPGPAGWGVYLVQDDRIIRLKGTLARATNNVAEYAGLLGCLRWCVKHRVTTVTIHMDSEVIVRQIHGLYGVGDALRSHYLDAVALLRQLGDGVTLVHVRRELNTEADRLANEAMDEAGFPRQRRPPGLLRARV
jgi:ribonuclease HI